MEFSTEILDLSQSLHAYLRQLSDALIAYSGGVDSAVVAYACHAALGERAVAAIGVGPAVAQAELSDARATAKVIGIRLVEIATPEARDPNYIRNDSQRCFHCKTNLFRSLQAWGNEHGWKTLVSGTNWDDLSDYRPGLRAASEFQVHAPLADLKISKKQVRELAAYYKLPVSDKPASPCLASRIAYGQEVTPDRLQMVELAEGLLKEAGFREVRVRLHGEGIARLEMHRDDWFKLLDDDFRMSVCSRIEEIGFQYVTMDLMGRRSGSLNRMLPVIS